MSLKASALNGVKWTTLSSVVSVSLHIVQLAILARMLAPGDFGLMALAMVAIGFAQAFSDMGISQAIIHKQNIKPEQLSTLYWLNLLAGFSCCTLLFISAPFIAKFYETPSLEPILFIISIIFVIQASGQQFLILLQKELQFKAIAKVEITAKLVDLTIAVTLAWYGWEVYALVFSTLASATVTAICYNLIGRREHRPQLVFNYKSVKDFLSFGLFTMGDRSINFLNLQIDTLLIGRLLGMEALGIYSLAKTLVMRPAQVINPIITRVSLPVMAKVQTDMGKLRQIYLHMIQHLSSVNFPVYTAIFVMAPVLVPLLLGKQWYAAIPLVQILSIWAAFRSMGNPVGSLILSKGRYKLGFWWNVSMFFLTVPTIWIGSHWGVTGIAYSLLAYTLVTHIPNWIFIVHPLCGARPKEYIHAMLFPASLGLIFGAALFVAFQSFDDYIGRGIINMIISSSVGGGLLVILYLQFNREFLMSITSILKSLKRRVA